MMYLTFDLNSAQLLSSSSSFESKIHENKWNIVHIDEWTATINRPDIDHIETMFDEQLQLNIIVPDQHTLDNSIKEIGPYFLKVINEGKQLFVEKIKIIEGPLPLSYVIYMTQIYMRTLSFEEIDFFFHIDSEKEYKDDLKDKITKINLIDGYYKTFKNKLKIAGSKESLDLALTELKKSFDNLNNAIAEINATYYEDS